MRAAAGDRASTDLDSTTVDATLSDPLVGRRLDGRYLVLARIGRGGMGVVYRAEDERLEREVALKVLRSDLAHDLDARQRFVREAKSAARLAHPGIVAVLDQGLDHTEGREETAYLVMELVQGRTLRDLVHDRGLLTPGEALDVTEKVLDALAEAHRKGVLHRDVKPANVLIGDDGRVKVADFGLARTATAAGAGSAGSGAELLGTAEYLAPEQVARGIADARSDIYGVGVLLFEMLTGTPPYSGDAPVRIAYRHVYDDAPAPSSLVATLPEEIDDLVLGALSKDPDDRPADAGAMLAGVRATRAALTPEQLSARGERPDLGGDDGHTVRIDLAGAGVRPGDTGTLDVSGHRGATDQSGNRRRRRTVLAMILTLVVLALAAGAAWFFLAGPGAYTTTPDVSGRSPAEATTALEGDGFAVVQDQGFSDTVAAGTVLGTDPGRGDRVRKGGTVTVVVSQGVQQFTVPAVVGSSQEDAEAALTGTGLAVGEIRPEFSEDVAEGDVIRADPAVGALVNHDSPVALVVSQGRQPIDVPGVAGSSLADARAAIEGAALTVGDTREEVSETVPAGDVISQSPADGTLFRGDAVTLVVSSGPPLVTVPNVQGKQLADARAELEGRGFKVAVQEVLGGFFGTVRSTDPAAGQSIPKGSTITVTVV